MTSATGRPCSVASAKLIASVAPGKGRAVFCNAPIEAGELIAVWGGTIITVEQAYALPRQERTQCLQIEEGLVLWTADSLQSTADWINHSCNPNSGMLGQIGLVAMRDIEPEEEICFDCHVQRLRPG